MLEEWRSPSQIYGVQARVGEGQILLLMPACAHLPSGEHGTQGLWVQFRRVVWKRLLERQGGRGKMGFSPQTPGQRWAFPLITR